jgi:hypothetical protein
MQVACGLHHEIRMALIENRKSLFETMRKNARNMRAKLENSTPDIMLFEQRLVTRLVLLLDVIKQRTARRHELQKAAT